MSDDKKKIVCKVCGKEFVRNCDISRHVRFAHGITYKDYHDKYISAPHLCPVCGEETPFVKTSYEEYCSFRCRKIAEGCDVESEPYKRKHNCLICGQKDIKQLKTHLKNEHGIDGLKQYYEKFYKRDGAGYCLECGKPTRFDEGLIEYVPYCSTACSNKNETHKEHMKKTCLVKYGVEYSSQADEVKRKVRKTNLERYGCIAPSQNEAIKQKIRETNLERYGYESPMKNDAVKQKARETNLERYGCECSACAPEVKEKRKQTNLERYGCEHHWENQSVKEKREETWLKNYGVVNPLLSSEVQEKIKKTNLERYGCENPGANKEVKERIKETCKEKYGTDYAFQSGEVKEKIHKSSLEVYGTDFPAQSDLVKEKIKQTNLEKYGCGNPMQNQEIIDKAKKTKTEDGAWNSSSAEDEVYSSLVGAFGKDGVVRQHKEERYNYKCDFYVESRDLFIELNAYKSHMGHWYDENNPEDVAELERLENSDKGYDNHMAKAWLGDAKKREAARQSNLNYVVFWRKEDFDLWASLDCPDGKDYIKEYSWLPDRPTLDPFCDFPKKLTPGTTICRAVAKAVNGDSLFYRECKMWEENPLHKGVFLQPWLYYNRLKYMEGHKNPEEITDAELIRGFTISGTIRGYSRYDVKPMKEILGEYNVKSVYDPCAGWGERLALCGALDISYEGVDINEKVVEGHNKIISHYNLGKNCSSTCGDSAEYTPKGTPDAVFTCPPYLAKEIYTEGGAENLSPKEFEKWWIKVCSNFPDSVEHVFIHIDEETKPYIISGLENNGWKLIEDRYFSKKNASHFNRGKGGEIKKKNWESVLIFSR